MASTFQLNDSINFALPFVGFRPLTLINGLNPAAKIANLVRQAMLNPPFTWRWNRFTATILAQPGFQDYKIACANFGFLEKWSVANGGTQVPVTNTLLAGNVATYSVSTALSSGLVGQPVSVAGSTNGSGVFNINNVPIASIAGGGLSFTVQLNAPNVSSAADTGTSFVSPQVQKENEVQLVLGDDTTVGRPGLLSAQGDDGAGNITFRLMPGSPDQTYLVRAIYQGKPSLFTLLTSTWSPIPDEFSYIYDTGFLALAMAVTQDPRFPEFNQRFVAHLLGAAEGLEETKKNLFQERWLATTSQVSARGMRQQQGIQGMGV